MGSSSGVPDAGRLTLLGGGVATSCSLSSSWLVGSSWLLADSIGVLGAGLDCRRAPCNFGGLNSRRLLRLRSFRLSFVLRVCWAPGSSDSGSSKLDVTVCTFSSIASLLLSLEARWSYSSSKMVGRWALTQDRVKVWSSWTLHADNDVTEILAHGVFNLCHGHAGFCVGEVLSGVFTLELCSQLGWVHLCMSQSCHTAVGLVVGPIP